MVSKRRNCIFEPHTPSIIIHAKIPCLALNFLKHTYKILEKDWDSTYFVSLYLPSNPSLGFLQLWHLAQCSVRQSSRYDECQMNAQCSGLWRKSGFLKNHTEKLYSMETTAMLNWHFINCTCEKAETNTLLVIPFQQLRCSKHW